MNEIIFSIVLTIILIGYFVLLYKTTSRNQNARVMSIAFAAIFVCGFIIHFIIYYRTAVTRVSLYDFVTLIFYSAQHSLRMFFAGSPIFRMLGDIKEIPALYYLFSITFYMAVMTSGFFIFNFISRSMYARRWLGKKRNIRQASKGGNSIFLGLNRYSCILAENLRNTMTEKGLEGMLISIELPDGKEQMAKLSIWEIIRQILVSKSKKSKSGPYDIMLKVKDNMKDLMPWLENPENDVYILSDDIKENIRIMEKLMQHQSIRCHIYCHARKDGLIAKYDSVADLNNQLTIIDSSFLAVEGLKKNPDLHPVNFVDVGLENGRRAGWISDKGFNAAVLGFGETGKESLSFLYEFAAFPTKDLKKAPFKCHVFDNNMECAAGEFLRKVPGIKHDEIEFHTERINTPDYWNIVGSMLDDLNYVIVSLGDDKTTLNAAIDLAEYAFRYRRSEHSDDNLHNFVILLRLCNPDKMDSITLDAANSVFGGCLRTFGNINDIWNHDVISNSLVKAMAEKFYNSYEMLSSGKVRLSWNDKLIARSIGSYKDRCMAQRHVSQTYSDCLHMETKKRICDPYYHQFARDIASPSSFDGVHHFIGTDAEGGKVMEYLAVGEKLRWNASHEILGYVKGDVTDDKVKTHQCLGSYDEIDAKVKHYDWLVVRNSLIN